MNYTKKVIFVPMALFCLGLPLAAESNVSAKQAMTELSAMVAIPQLRCMKQHQRLRIPVE